MMLKLKLQYFGHLMRRVDSDAGRDWGQEEKGTTEDEMAGWHHWPDGLESEWTLGVCDGQGGLVCCDSWGRKESDMTEWLTWLTDLHHILIMFNLCLYYQCLIYNGYNVWWMYLFWKKMNEWLWFWYVQYYSNQCKNGLMFLNIWGERDGMGREEGRGFRMGNTCIPVVDSFCYMAKPIQYCKVKK